MGVSNVIFRLDERFSPSGESIGNRFWKYKPCDACLKHLNAAAVTGSERPRIQGITSYRLPREEKSVDFAVNDARVFLVAIEIPFRTVFHTLWKTVEPRRAEGMVWANYDGSRLSRWVFRFRASQPGHPKVVHIPFHWLPPCISYGLVVPADALVFVSGNGPLGILFGEAHTRISTQGPHSEFVLSLKHQPYVFHVFSYRRRL